MTGRLSEENAGVSRAVLGFELHPTDCIRIPLIDSLMDAARAQGFAEGAAGALEMLPFQADEIRPAGHTPAPWPRRPINLGYGDGRPIPMDTSVTFFPGTLKMTAPSTPRELLTQLAIWHAEHEARPASREQTAMTSLYSAMRDVLDEHRGVAHLRDQLTTAFPDLQEDIWAANRAPGLMVTRGTVESHGDISSLIAARAVALPGDLVDCPVCKVTDSERRKELERAATSTGRYYDADDIDRLVRQLDVALNGAGAAKQARLCDVVGQAIDQHWRLVRTDEAVDIAAGVVGDLHRESAQGILDRAKERGATLPPVIEDALRSVAATATADNTSQHIAEGPETQAAMDASRVVESDPPTSSDIIWAAKALAGMKDNGHCGEGTFERRERADWNGRIDRVIRFIEEKAPSA